MTQTVAAKLPATDYGLRREILSPMETLAQSVSTIAPTTSPAATIPLVCALAGNGTWLAYALATAAVLLVALCIGRYARQSASPGSPGSPARATPRVAAAAIRRARRGARARRRRSRPCGSLRTSRSRPRPALSTRRIRRPQSSKGAPQTLSRRPFRRGPHDRRFAIISQTLTLRITYRPGLDNTLEALENCSYAEPCAHFDKPHRSEMNN